MPKRSGTVLHGYTYCWWEPTSTTYRPEGVIVEEDTMSMEKRAVVNTDKEKTAAKKVEKSLPQDKPNQQPKPPTKKDK
jgi:hypothetical protein